MPNDSAAEDTTTDFLATAEQLKRKAEESRPVLAQAAKNVMQLSGGSTPEVLARYAELQFLLNLIDRDLLTLIAVQFREPWSRLTTEKLIAMSGLEAERAVDKLMAQLIAAAKNQDPQDRFLDTDKLIQANAEWHAAKNRRDEDKALKEVISALRNNATAHIYGRDERLNVHVPWVLTRWELPEESSDVAKSQILSWATAVTKSVHTLGTRLGPMRLGGTGRPRPSRKQRRAN